jgi:erythromycin esterase
VRGLAAAAALSLVALVVCVASCDDPSRTERARDGQRPALLGKVGAEPRPDRRPSPPDRLLDDDALRSEPFATDADQATVAWVQSHARPIRSLVHDDDLSDLAFLDPLVAGRRVVMLGESSHGVSEFSQAKTRLVKFLHQRHGFDVVVFESGLFGCELAQRAAAAATPLETMRSSIFAIWQTREVLDLFAYLDASERSARPIALAGMDCQHSGRTATPLADRLRIWRELVATVDTAYAREVARLVADLAARAPRRDYTDLAAAERHRFRAGFRRLVAFLESRQDTLVAARPDDALLPAIALQAARNDHHALGIFRAGEFNSAARDSVLADNLEFLLDVRFPERRVVVWAHNAHVRRHGSAIAPPHGFRSLGELMAARRPDEIYAVGLFMGHGFAATNQRDRYAVPSPPEGSLAALLSQAGWRHLFLDLASRADASADRVPTWFTRPQVARSWGTVPCLQELARQYDGLLYVHEVQEPVYR